MAGQFLGFLAAAGLISMSVATVGETRSVQALPVVFDAQAAAQAGEIAADGPQCTVNVFRTGKPGVLDVTRQVTGGSCVCNVTTGPDVGNGPVEASVAAILQNRSCPGAKELAEVAASSGGGSGGFVAGGIGALAGGAGISSGLGGSSAG